MSRVRIIGGRWKRRWIPVVALPGVRPSPDAVRETLFNWLGQDLAGLACLDLFAGTGVLGFEAASRGARQVDLVDRDPRIVAQLERNAAALGGEQLEIFRADALKFLDHPPRRYDLIFLDPPFRQGWIERLAPRLPAVLNPDARLYVEAEHPVEHIGAWQSVRHGRSGQVHYQLLETPQS